MSQSNSQSVSVKQAALSTLAYFDLFEIPLTLEEVQKQLLFTEASLDELGETLDQSPQLRKMEDRYGLKGDIYFLEAFHQKQLRAQEYWKRVERWRWLLELCPFVEGVSICNSLPIENIEENSDIDLLIHAKEGHLFSARIFTVFFTHFFGLRRHGKKTRKRFCLSFYTTPEAWDFTTLQRGPYDIYLAYWLKTLQPITGDLALHQAFLGTNLAWLNNFFAHPELDASRLKKSRWWTRALKNLLEKIFGSPTWENRFKGWLWDRMQRKKSALPNASGTIITEHMLKFHDHDAREEISKKWLEGLAQIDV